MIFVGSKYFFSDRNDWIIGFFPKNSKNLDELGLIKQADANSALLVIVIFEMEENGMFRNQ